MIPNSWNRRDGEASPSHDAKWRTGPGSRDTRASPTALPIDLMPPMNPRTRVFPASHSRCHASLANLPTEAYREIGRHVATGANNAVKRWKASQKAAKKAAKKHK